jgi:hypothetical protein
MTNTNDVAKFSLCNNLPYCEMRTLCTIVFLLESPPNLFSKS